MTMLEWCRKNAPDALKDLTDEELLVIMEPSAVELAAEQGITFDDVKDAVEYKNDKLDYIVLELVREFGDALAFKGGYMLTRLIPEQARRTMDVDFSIQSSELYQSLITAMERIGEHFVSEGTCATYKVKQEIRPFMSGGMDMYDADGTKILGIDVGWHDITFGTTTTNIDVADVRAFEIERMLADKICAILSRKRFRRPKDVYDVYCISNSFDFSATKVYDYIIKRTEGVGAEWCNFPLSEVILREYAKAYDKLNVQPAFVNTHPQKPPFNVVMDRFYNIGFAVRDNRSVIWRHKEGVFR